MKVLAISGWKQSGKDTLTGYLVDKYGAVRTSFADPLKDSVAEEFGINRTFLDDPDRKEAPLPDMPVAPKDAYSRMIAEFLVKEFRSVSGAQAQSYTIGDDGKFYGKINDSDAFQLFWTPRALAILKGSTNRSVMSNFWVQKAIQSIVQSHKEGFDLHVISDLRYQSEMSQLKEAFGEDVTFIRVNRFDSSPSSDPSERDLDKAEFDYVVTNKGSKEEAFAQMDRIIRLVVGPVKRETLPKFGY